MNEIQKLAKRLYPMPKYNATRLDLQYVSGLQQGFIKGYQTAKQDNWTSVGENLPIATQSGSWDGLRSDLVLCVNRSGDYVIARLYTGFTDGNNFADWCDVNDFLLDTKAEQIVKWKPID